ncbi:Ranatuerin-3RC [Aquarana catesbeiana]|uniref:Ranatuerin-3RC n=1 Tax=Aquarana catesbeiana TaxID=8400 RepID=A0A2G9Q0K4_AQUCT|nr:Ranatuerin-3RC [Aquarana catesbeiana]
MFFMSSPRRDADEVKEVKRGFLDIIKNLGKTFAGHMLDKIKCTIGTCPPSP